ncbi:LexA family transcriptional regulator [Listeria monocytogenes]|nr:LexA family transcriptional regulator [Listeria monocytogenes]
MLLLRYKSEVVNIETMGERIKRLRLERKLTQEELGNKFGLKRAAINKYEKGNVENMKRSIIEEMSSFFDVTPSYLMALDESSSIETIYNKLEPPRQKNVLKVAKKELSEQQLDTQQKITSLEQHRQKRQLQQELGEIDWCGAVSAGTGEFLSDDNKEKISLPIEMIPDGADFCLSVNGDSMEPIFHDDAYVFISKQCTLYSGAIGAVIVNGEAFLKRIWFENNHARLESFNKKYKDIIVTEDDDFKIIGKVVM